MSHTLKAKCDDCGQPATIAYYQKTDLSGRKIAEREADSKGLLLRLCDKHHNGVNRGVWAFHRVYK